ncbi:MAG: hypothetical protein ACI37U_00830 [Bacteroides sp.]
MRTLSIKYTIVALSMLISTEGYAQPIDRRAVVERHRIVTTQDMPQSPAQVGNGEFAFGMDITGLQTFVPHHTQSHWGWHSFPLPAGCSLEQYHGKEWNVYGRQVSLSDRDETHPALSDWMCGNPHRINLGRVGMVLLHDDGTEARPDELTETRQETDLWTGLVVSTFRFDGEPVRVVTACHGTYDAVGVDITSPLLQQGRLQIAVSFSYPDASQDVNDSVGSEALHQSILHRQGRHRALVERRMDDTRYSLALRWQGDMQLIAGEVPHRFRLQGRQQEGRLRFSFAFTPADNKQRDEVPSAMACIASSKKMWSRFWQSGGAIDLSGSRDPRWSELERRIVLSQYQLRMNEAGSQPPQESGLVNSFWYGRFHLEMLWWHGVHYALWGRWPLLRPMTEVYSRYLPTSTERARKQGFAGARWPKCTGNIDRDWPFPIHATLVWQQPHPIYFAELDYRQHPVRETLLRWKEVVRASADFMASYVGWDEARKQYVLGPPLYIVSENTDPLLTRNATFELSYWRYGLRTASTWMKRLGEPVPERWTEVLQHLSPLPVEEGVYPTYEGIPDMWTHYTWEHPGLTGIYGMLPGDGVDIDTFRLTFGRVLQQWQMDRIWGWDFPMMAMAAARLGLPSRAIDLLLYDTHQFQFDVHGLATGGPFPYFPSNGGLLAAVAMMAAGWDGAPDRPAPGFPDDGSWSVRAEGLFPIE